MHRAESNTRANLARLSNGEHVTVISQRNTTKTQRFHCRSDLFEHFEASVCIVKMLVMRVNKLIENVKKKTNTDLFALLSDPCPTKIFSRNI